MSSLQKTVYCKTCFDASCNCARCNTSTTETSWFCITAHWCTLMCNFKIEKLNFCSFLYVRNCIIALPNLNSFLFLFSLFYFSIKMCWIMLEWVFFQLNNKLLLNRNHKIKIVLCSLYFSDRRYLFNLHVI